MRKNDIVLLPPTSKEIYGMVRKQAAGEIELAFDESWLGTITNFVALVVNIGIAGIVGFGLGSLVIALFGVSPLVQAAAGLVTLVTLGIGSMMAIFVASFPRRSWTYRILSETFVLRRVARAREADDYYRLHATAATAAEMLTERIDPLLSTLSSEANRAFVLATAADMAGAQADTACLGKNERALLDEALQKRNQGNLKRAHELRDGFQSIFVLYKKIDDALELVRAKAECIRSLMHLHEEDGELTEREWTAVRQLKLEAEETLSEVWAMLPLLEATARKGHDQIGGRELPILLSAYNPEKDEVLMLPEQ